jgi:hypothetical protein
MAQLAHRQRGTLEAGVVPVHEQHDFLAVRDSEPPRNLGLQLLLRLFVRLDDGGYTSYAIRSDNDFIRYGGKRPSSVVGPSLSRSGLTRCVAVLSLTSTSQETSSPNSIIADPNAIERDRLAVYGGSSACSARCAIGDEQQIERRPATVDRQLGEKRLGIRPV